MSKLPEHIAVIMDGNGRWARRRNQPRIMGHRKGVEIANVISQACAERGIKALTLYTFSSENWNRPENEVKALMGLLEQAISNYSRMLSEYGIRFKAIGRIGDLGASLEKAIKRVEQETSGNTGMVLSLALNYGGRQEICDAVSSIYEADRSGELRVSSITPELLSGYMYTSGLPDPDLIVRTSGEQRLSNFLLWQSAYSELYFTETLWPDFDVKELDKALEEYGRRDRRFGE
ncbi:MAG: isoprenyl transferase [Candidatus Omnitrophica bacterium]|nr:isoprenyl transferase [Candidatus Omnitrophota bacterium]MDD5487590.1 isoprenyl transferase [Candidatus Omnitrophota bacterium]